jgi:hypothetical protein
VSAVFESGQTELVSRSVIDELGAVAREHRVMVSITVTPYDDDDAEPEEEQ